MASLGGQHLQAPTSEDLNRQKLYARNIKLLVTPPLVAVRESIAKSVERPDLKVKLGG